MPDDQIVVLTESRAVAAPGRRVVRLAFVVAFLSLVVSLIYYGIAVHKAVIYPFGIDPGEGNIWQQLREIAAGGGFGPINGFPAIGFEYPPVYHFFVAVFSGVTGLDQLAAGRLLSVISTFAMSWVIAAIVARMTREEGGSGRSAWICGTIAALMIFTLVPVLHWSRFMRVDMLALFFSFAGFYFGTRALVQPRAIHLAALCFVAAIFTKQTSIAAPVAVFGLLLVLRPRIAWPGIATGIVTSFAALAYLCWRTDNGFLEHILFNNVNRMDYSRLLQVPSIIGFHSLYFCVAMIGAVTYVQGRLPDYRNCRGVIAVRNRIASSTGDSQHLMVFGYFLLTSIMLVTYAKLGATYNYFIEWLCVVTVIAGLSLRIAADYVTGSDRKSASFILMIFFPVAIAVQACILSKTPQDEKNWGAAQTAELNRLSQLVRAADRPVISDEMVLLIKSGKPVVWEPSIFAELASLGR